MSTRRIRSTSVHVTSRGRVLIILGLAGLLFGAFSLGRAGSQASTAPAVAPSLMQVTVAPGETLWSVARRIAPESDPRAVVQQIKTANDLAGSGLRAGQQLLLPAAA